MKLRKSISAATSLVMVLATPIATAFAEGEDSDIKTWGDYTYTIAEDGISIEKYSGEDMNPIIPEEIEGETVTVLGNAFAGSDIESVTIGENIKHLSTNAFVNCYSLKEINVVKENTKFESIDGVLYTEDMTFVLCYPSAKEGDTYEIPEGVTDLGIASFYDTKLKSISFPSTLEYIDRHSMSYNEHLKEADLSNTSLSAIGEMAFAGDTALESVIFPVGLYEIEGGAFASCHSLKEVELPEGIASIEQNAFADTGLTEITIPASVQNIGYCAFGYDADLNPIENFVIKGTAGSVAQTYANDTDEEYGYTNSFEFVTSDGSTPEGYEKLKGIKYNEFEYAEKDGEAYITFCDQSLLDVKIPSEINGLPVTVIYAMAFFQSEAKSIELPATLKRIEEGAFYDCDFLESIDIPEGVEFLADRSFYNCEKLTKANIPSTCTEIGYNSFSACPILSEINVAEGNTAYKTIDGVLFNADGTTLIKFPDGKSSTYKVPDGVTTIDEFAFSENPNIVEVDLGNTSDIGVDAFSFCDMLKTVKMGNSVKNIGDYAFYECKELENIELSNELVTVGEYAFYDCPKIPSVRTGDKLESIGSFAFGYVYNTNDGSNQLVDGFRIYADENTGGAGYGENNGIEVISGTMDIGGKNVDKNFLAICGGLVGLGAIGGITSVILKKKKSAK